MGGDKNVGRFLESCCSSSEGLGPGGGYDEGEEQRAGYKVSTTPLCKHSFNRHVLSQLQG